MNHLPYKSNHFIFCHPLDFSFFVIFSCPFSFSLCTLFYHFSIFFLFKHLACDYMYYIIHNFYNNQSDHHLQVEKPTPNTNLNSHTFTPKNQLRAMEDDSSSAAYIHLVHRLIEECILFNMTKEECMEALSKHADIKPIITSTVWKELEKENKDFFEAYSRNREEIASGRETRQRIQNMVSDSS